MTNDERSQNDECRIRDSGFVILSSLVILSFGILCTACSAQERWSLPAIVELADNESTPERVELGKILFFDRGLSANGTIACASCHEPARAFTDGRPLAVGINGQVGRRNSPTLIGVPYGRLFMWDARIGPYLEGQPQAPLLSAGEHGMTEAAVETYLRSQPIYAPKFAAAYRQVPSFEGAVKALACFMREITSFNAPIDRYLKGETWALDRRQKRGLAVFLNCSQANGYDDAKKLACTSGPKAAEYFSRPYAGSCAVCHSGINFAYDFDGVHRWHNVGAGVLDNDLGRQIITDEGVGGNRHREDIDAYKTPTLRELRLTNPYGHRGQWATVREVIEFKARGGDADPFEDRNVFAYRWTEQEKQDLEYFLLTAFQGDFRTRMAKIGVAAQ